jgi:type II secretory pathway component PulC
VGDGGDGISGGCASGTSIALKTRMRKILRAFSMVAVLAGGMTVVATAQAAEPAKPASASTERLVPTLRDGKLIGFKTYALKPESPYAKAGCQNGDTIEAIDGVAITTPEDLGRIETGLRTNGVVKLTVRRRGQPLAAPLELRR